MDEREEELGEESLSRLLDDPDFETVHTRMARFNIFEAVGGVRGELRHSNFLAYLLSPGRSHGLGSAPLGAVLRAILEYIPEQRRPVFTLEVILGDLSGAVVYREQDNIDVLVEIDSLNLVVAIENKVDSGESGEQLARYRSVVESKYPSKKKLYVFLTPTGADPSDPAYTPFSYIALSKILEEVASTAANSESSLIVRHYVEMLRRHIVPDERLKDLAIRLYERHSEALDFIFESRPRPSGLLETMQEVIEGETARFDR